MRLSKVESIGDNLLTNHSRMDSSLLKLIFILIVLASGVNGQNECYDDGDCNQRQYCYTASKLCVNHTQCGLYNRKEGVKPARQPSQCGDCISGYTAEKLVEGEARPLCQKITSSNGNNDNVSEPSSLPTWAICLIVICIVIFGSAIIFTIYIFWKRYRRNVEPENENAHPPMMQNNIAIEASAPPAPFSHNNNDYSDAEENSPLSSTRYHNGSIVVASSKPVKAQAYRPPHYVREDENYNPGDTTEAVGTVGSLPEIDEDTVPSTWRPSADQATLNSVTNRPFIAINMEQEENETNAALDNIRVCPSSTNNSEERLPGNGQQQNGASTSEDAESNNNRRNHTSTQLINITVNANLVNLSGSGKNC